MVPLRGRQLNPDSSATTDLLRTWCLCWFALFGTCSPCMLKGPVAEPHPLQFLTHEPDTENARNFIVVENIGIDGIDRHGWSAGLQDYKVARLSRSRPAWCRYQKRRDR